MRRVAVLYSSLILACALGPTVDPLAAPDPADEAGLDSAAGPALTLEQALRIGLEHNPVLAAIRSGTAESRADVRAVRAERWPRLMTEAAWHRTDQQVFAFGDKLTAAEFTADDFLLDNLNDPDPVNHLSAALALEFPIDASGRIAARIEGAREGEEAARARLRAAEADLVFRITESYHAISLARAARDVGRSALENARTHESTAAARHQSGTALRSDLLRARVARLERERDLERREAELSIARSRLLLELGLESSEPVDPADQLEAPDEELAPLDLWLARARDRRPEIAVALRQAAAAEAAVREARAALGPDADGTARIEHHGSGLSGGDQAFFVGVRLRWTFLDPARSGQIESARARARAGASLARSVEQSVRLEVERAWRDARVAAFSLVSAAEAARAAAEARRVSAERYAAGLLPLTDLLDTETALVAARMAELQALYDAVVGRARLARSAGSSEVPR